MGMSGEWTCWAPFVNFSAFERSAYDGMEHEGVQGW